MPDLLAGTTVTALDTPPTVENQQNGNYTFTNTSYGVGTTGGTYVDCGVAFTACTTGRAKIEWRGQIDNDTAAQFTALSYVLRTGNVVGSGTVVQAADDTRALVMSGTDVMANGTSDLVSGLTPGDAYNVRLEHKVGGNTGTAERRAVVVSPAT